MVKYENINRAELTDLTDKNGGRTLIAPESSGELSEWGEREFSRGVERSVDVTEPLFTYSTYEGEDTIQTGFIRLDVLEVLLYEHRRYSRSKGFSDTELEVLKAIEFSDKDRVTLNEVMESDYANQVSDSSVYNALNNLQDKSLINKIEGGLYQYTGP